jgi:membrane dipeptidase
MKRRTFLVAAAGALTLDIGQSGADEPPPAVVDLHVDLSYQLTYKEKSIARASGNLLADELVRSGYVGVVLPLYIPHDVAESGPRLEDLERSYRRITEELRQREPFAIPGTVADARSVRTWLAFEGAAPLASAPATRIDVWVARGARLFGLVHVHDNLLATSSGATAAYRNVRHGLSATGRQFVEQVHAAGGVIDVSHASDATVADVVALARSAVVPVVATHSNARALASHSRNLSDEQLRAIADLGGVVGVNFHGPYLCTGRAPTMEDVVRHVRHMVRVAGVEHVAIGSDFEGGIREPPGLEDVRGLPRLAAHLRAAGLPRPEIERIFSTNALRVLERSS